MRKFDLESVEDIYQLIAGVYASDMSTLKKLATIYDLNKHLEKAQRKRDIVRELEEEKLRALRLHNDMLEKGLSEMDLLH